MRKSLPILMLFVLTAVVCLVSSKRRENRSHNATINRESMSVRPVEDEEVLPADLDIFWSDLLRRNMVSNEEYSDGLDKWLHGPKYRAINRNLGVD